MDTFSFNTAVARLMELLNALYKYDAIENKNVSVYKDSFKKFIALLAPCAPHFAEEIWESLGMKSSVFNSSYPECDEKALVKDEVEFAIQINSKIKCKMTLPNEIGEDDIKAILLSDEKLKQELAGKTIKKLIIVPKRLINVIV